MNRTDPGYGIKSLPIDEQKITFLIKADRKRYRLYFYIRSLLDTFLLFIYNFFQ